MGIVMAPEGANGLEGRFNANVGDLIRLRGKSILMRNEIEIEVAGYVVSVSPFRVKLSHENPLGGPVRVFSGSRRYNLAEFQTYEVLK